MPRAVDQHFAVITMDGAPPEVVEAFRANASDDPHVVACALQYLHERTGAFHTWDSETKGFEPVSFGIRRMPVIHVPARREPVASPGEQGRRARRSSAPTRGSPPDDPDLEAPPVETWRGLVVASTGMVRRCERRRAKLAAP
jgi:hypothetical protein